MVTVTSPEGEEREYDQPSFSLTEVAKAIGLGRTATYARAKKGTLPTVRMDDPTPHKKTRDGTLVRVSARTLDALLHPEEYADAEPFDADIEEHWIANHGGLEPFPSPFTYGKRSSVSTPEPVEATTEPEQPEMTVDADATWFEEWQRRDQESREKTATIEPRVTLERRGEERARRREMAAQIEQERPGYLELTDPLTGDVVRVYEDVLPRDATPEDIAEHGGNPFPGNQDWWWF